MVIAYRSFIYGQNRKNIVNISFKLYKFKTKIKLFSFYGHLYELAKNRKLKLFTATLYNYAFSLPGWVS